MTESLFTVQTPVVPDASDGGANGISTATSVRFLVNGNVTGIRFFSTTTIGGTYTAELWHVDSADDPGPGTGTLLATEVAGAPPASATWNTIMFDSPVAVVTNNLYRATINNSEGRYVATLNFFASPLTNGNIVGEADSTDPVGLGTLRNGTFEPDSAPGVYPNNASGSTCFFADVLFETGSAVTGTAVADLGALTGTASGLVTVPGSGVTDLGALNGTAQGQVTGFGSAASNLGRLTATALGTTPSRTSPVQHLDEILSTMLACLCEAAAARPRPPQHCCYRIGPEVAHDVDVFTDLCCEGLAYVSLGDIYPVVDSFPEQSIVTQANQVCSFPSWAVNIKAGILRCVPVGTDTSMPSCDDWNTAMAQHIFDTQSLASAACCFKQAWVFDIEPGMSVVIGPNSTTSPQGGCVERFITLQVQTSVCPSC